MTINAIEVTEVTEVCENNLQNYLVHPITSDIMYESYIIFSTNGLN